LAWDLLRAECGITCRMPHGAFPPRLEGRHDARLAAPFLPTRILRPNTATGVGQGLARWYAPAKTLTFYSAICFVHTKIILLGTERIY
jgi:hypothetical protein